MKTNKIKYRKMLDVIDIRMNFIIEVVLIIHILRYLINRSFTLNAFRCMAL